MRIAASPGERPKLPGLIRPLLVDDVPTILVWFGRPPDDLDVFRPLCELADHAVFDASLLADPLEDTARLTALPAPLRERGIGGLRPLATARYCEAQAGRERAFERANVQPR